MASDLGTTNDGASAATAGSTTDAPWTAPTGAPADLAPPSDSSADAATLTEGDLGPEISGWSDRTRSVLGRLTVFITSTARDLESTAEQQHWTFQLDRESKAELNSMQRLHQVRQSGEKLCAVVDWVSDSHIQHGKLSDEQVSLAKVQLDAIAEEITTLFQTFDLEKLQSDITAAVHHQEVHQNYRTNLNPSGNLAAEAYARLALQMPHMAEELGELLSGLQAELGTRLDQAHSLVAGGPDAFRHAIRATDGASADLAGSTTDALWPAPTSAPADLAPLGDIGQNVSVWSDRSRLLVTRLSRLVTDTAESLSSAAEEQLSFSLQADSKADLNNIQRLHQVRQSGEKLFAVVDWVSDSHIQHGKLSDEQVSLAKVQLDTIAEEITTLFQTFDFEKLQSDILTAVYDQRQRRPHPVRQHDGTYLAANPRTLEMPDRVEELGENLSSLQAELETRLDEAHALVVSGPDAFRNAIRANMSVVDATTETLRKSDYYKFRQLIQNSRLVRSSQR